MDAVIVLLISIIAGISTYIVSNILKRGPVISSAIITLASGLILPYFFPIRSELFTAAAACSSYAGMISVENALNLTEMTIISLMTGILFIAANGAYVGIGGRLGTIAAISCFTWLGFKKVFGGLEGNFTN